MAHHVAAVRFAGIGLLLSIGYKCLAWQKLRFMLTTEHEG
jgi:hypothetical protein